MNINIDKLISELEARKKSHNRKSKKYLNDSRYYNIPLGQSVECDFWIQKLAALKNEQPEAITDDAHFCKHDVEQSAASNEITDKEISCAASSETQAVEQNEQTKERCNHKWVRGYRALKCSICGELAKSGIDNL